mmetsp:Transcript_4066/g.9787  ORF Transcript_4066/g.9787 Transcript_4066/m.9787 type:complete len:115 (-) Transcript_4066:325-669(-)
MTATVCRIAWYQNKLVATNNAWSVRTLFLASVPGNSERKILAAESVMELLFESLLKRAAVAAVEVELVTFVAANDNCGTRLSASRVENIRVSDLKLQDQNDCVPMKQCCYSPLS